MPDDVHCRGGVVDARGECTGGNIDQLAEPEPDILDVSAFKPGGHGGVDVVSQFFPDCGCEGCPGSAGQAVAKGTPSTRELPGSRSIRITAPVSSAARTVRSCQGRSGTPSWWRLMWNSPGAGTGSGPRHGPVLREDPVDGLLGFDVDPAHHGFHPDLPGEMRQEEHQPNDTCYGEHESDGDGNFRYEGLVPLRSLADASKDGQRKSEGSQERAPACRGRTGRR